MEQLRERILSAFRSALEAARPEILVRDALSLQGSYHGNRSLRDLASSKNPVHLFASGKAAGVMLRPVVDIIGPRLQRVLCISTESAPASLPAGTVCIQGDHPVPGPGSAEAGKTALQWMRDFPPEEEHQLLALLSGGTSSLLGYPHDQISTADLAETTALLLNSGAGIRQINTVRKHLCPALGGGLLGALPAEAEPVILLLSDVPGNDLTTIGSGPFIPDPTTVEDARSVIGSFHLSDRLPPPVRDLLFTVTTAPLLETLKPGARTVPPHIVLADNGFLLEKIGTLFRDARLTRIVGRNEQDNVTEAVHRHLDLIEEYRREIPEGPIVLISGGELSVKVSGTGRGGRSTHYALEFLVTARRRGLRAGQWVLLSAGSDGRDGATGAAGALVDSRTLEKGKAFGLDPERRLEEFDSFGFFDATGDLVVTGPTGNNLNDVRVVILA